MRLSTVKRERPCEARGKGIERPSFFGFRGEWADPSGLNNPAPISNCLFDAGGAAMQAGASSTSLDFPGFLSCSSRYLRFRLRGRAGLRTFLRGDGCRSLDPCCGINSYPMAERLALGAGRPSALAYFWIGCQMKAGLIFLFLAANVVSGCATSNPVADAPSWMGGLPAGAPPRPGTPAYDAWQAERAKEAARPKNKQ